MTALALLLTLTGITPVGNLDAVRVGEAPLIDGLLDDAVWQQADMECCTMWQYGPDYGEPMSEDTEFYILYDDDNLYLGFLMYDPDQESMMEALTPRDNYITGEWMAVLLDTWNDGREATSFEVSLANSQMESKISPNGGWDYGWDAVWESGTSRVPEGWSAEFAIPWSCLRFSVSDPDLTWGINFQRILSRTSENGWYMLTDCSQMADLNSFATLTGISGISGSLGMELRPYGSGRFYHEESDDSWIDTWEAGLDMKVGLSSGITADFTLNPDFGQVEADAVEMNLSHFELFLRDRRPFFLESRNIFEMPFDMFYSRRVGAVAANGEVIPIIGGAKVSGSFGDGFRFGFLDAVTSRIWEDDSTLVEMSSNYGIMRGYKQFGSWSYLGVSAVSRETWEQEDIPGEYSRAIALDGAIELPGSHLLDAAIARSWNTGLEDDGACMLSFRKIRSTFSFDAGGRYVGENFDVNATGYTTETGYYETWGSAWQNIRPEEVFSEIGFGGNLYYSRLTDGQTTARHVGLDSHASLKNGLRFGLDLSWSGSRFDPYEGPEGHYYDGAFDFFADGGTSPFDPFSAWIGIGGGQWNSEGTFGNYMANLRFRPSAALELSLEGQLFRTRDTENYNWDPDVSDFDSRSTDWKSLIMRMNYMFSPALNLRLFSQYSLFSMDYHRSPVSESREILANALLSWEYRPGSMIFLLSENVFQGDENGEFHNPDFGFYAKLTWYLTI
jgi:hypothetical protein